MTTCQELHDAYIKPIIKKGGQQDGYPKIVWIKSMQGIWHEKRCGISTVDLHGVDESFTAVWESYEELPDIK
jgi:hypothetical protein